MKLPQVTLLTVSGLGYQVSEHQEALKKSCLGIEFGAVKYIQTTEIKNLDDYSYWMIYKLKDYVDTEFVLTVQADGWVINPQLWNDDWLNYDYIGAPFPIPKDSFSYRDIKGQIQWVGNGAVSLRSKRLIELAPKLNLEWKSFHGYYNEDGFICVNNRHIYEEHGMKFASVEVAKYFSKEFTTPENKNIKTFAFHKYL